MTDSLKIIMKFVDLNHSFVSKTSFCTEEMGTRVLCLLIMASTTVEMTLDEIIKLNRQQSHVKSNVAGTTWVQSGDRGSHKRRGRRGMRGHNSSWRHTGGRKRQAPPQNFEHYFGDSVPLRSQRASRRNAFKKNHTLSNHGTSAQRTLLIEVDHPILSHRGNSTHRRRNNNRVLYVPGQTQRLQVHYTNGHLEHGGTVIRQKTIARNARREFSVPNIQRRNQHRFINNNVGNGVSPRQRTSALKAWKERNERVRKAFFGRQPSKTPTDVGKFERFQPNVNPDTYFNFGRGFTM
ncbi:unnamed protein product [Caenorhabditis auriculariae]|uniref:Uncharacterized protein n=1 Tax=Caenorhabditis auriculariae TaxID=2777116 RepID=A0A8S1HXR9_9PELO|nr:unnamed protein product [Caenorhabditis auriculariae]